MGIKSSQNYPLEGGVSNEAARIALIKGLHRHRVRTMSARSDAIVRYAAMSYDYRRDVSRIETRGYI